MEVLPNDYIEPFTFLFRSILLIFLGFWWTSICDELTSNLSLFINYLSSQNQGSPLQFIILVNLYVKSYLLIVYRFWISLFNSRFSFLLIFWSFYKSLILLFLFPLNPYSLYLLWVWYFVLSLLFPVFFLPTFCFTI